MSLPKVLAGPIVRRVDADGVAVWIALSEPATKIELTAWRGIGHVSTGPGRVTSGDPPQTTGEGATLPLGIGLHVAVVVAEFSGGSPPSQIFSYDVVVDDVGLLGLGLLADEAPSVAADGRPGRLALGYAPDVLPSFVTPPADLADLRFAQASCRNPKQPGHDAMPWLDDVLARTIADPVQRPQQLFLTGDQVYVDDVAAVHLAMLADLGVELVGDESMPFADLPGGTDGPEFVKVTRASVPPLRRKHPVRTIARFSNAAGHSHLLTRGEFAAMYLSAWSPSVWRPLVGDTELTAKPAPPESDPDARSLTKMASTWPEAKDLAALARDRANLERFRDQLPRVARALANIATYMIADDHEIADDWNLTQSWTARVRLSPLGSSIIRHGLGAFFVFQAWGNDPSFYGQGGRLKPKAGRERKILDLLVADAAALSDRRGEQSVDDLDDAFGLTPTLGANPAPQLRFDFRVESLVHVVVGLDTRTRRAASRGPESPPNLLGTTIDDQIPAGPLSDGRLLLVLCAEPLLKPVAFESLVKPAATAVFDIKSYAAYTGELGDPARPLRGFEKYEVESFGAVELHFEAVLERLSSHPRVVVLSGEIHFAVDMVLDYFPGGEGAATSRIVQLTASAAKNPVSPMEQMVTRSHRWARTALHAESFERLGWRRPAPIQLPAAQSIPPGRRARMLRDVALLPAADWPKGTMIPTGEDPDWTWRLRSLRDERPDPIRLPPPQPPLPTFDPSRPLESAALIAARHAELARSPNEPVRGIVFRANIGVVRFERTEPDGVKVVHDVYSADGPTIETGSVYTRHEIELEAPSPSDRPVLGFVP
jgi:hypothetical protein